jgi:hypothetical protein
MITEVAFFGLVYTQDDHERYRELFEASTMLLRIFEDRQVLSLIIPHHAGRSTLDETYVDYSLRRLNSLLNGYPPEFVCNMEGACWRLFEAL